MGRNEAEDTGDNGGPKAGSGSFREGAQGWGYECLPGETPGNLKPPGPCFLS